ncbi:MAG TPA: sigma-70 family RNA polymerase sigma factor [Verrucomicrobiae bacterium]|nr:sigma-70 family RNA polymerase sigma factor [Verrucomicrobiae bacterium]
MTSDLDLLGQFARGKSQDAFTALVQRHVNLVYSAALRQVRSPQLAEEVAQSVFADLARGAGKLAGGGDVPSPECGSDVSSQKPLTPWLYAVARRTAIDVVRKESRRQLREQIAVELNAMNAQPQLSHFAKCGNDSAWPDIEPLLDDAMAALDETDRAAILLRFFENKNLREVGAALGTSDDAAQKRVSRAVEQLREFFVKRGATVGAGGLGVVISANAVQAAPVGLAVTISAAAVIAGAAVHTSTVIAATKTITMTTLQKILVAAALTTAVGAGIFEAHQVAQLRKQNQTLQQQQAPLAEQIRRLQIDDENLSNRLTEIIDFRKLSDKQFGELLKLRNAVTLLKHSANDPMDIAAKDLLAKVNKLKQRLEQTPNAGIPELQLLNDQDWLTVCRGWNLDSENGIRNALSGLRSMAEQKFSNMTQEALAKFSKANDKLFPTDLSQLQPYFDSPVDAAILQRWEILPAGATLPGIGNEGPFVTQKAPVDELLDRRWAIGVWGSACTDFLNSEIQDVMGPVYEAYNAANKGAYSGDGPSDYLPFATTPEQKAAAQKLVEQAAVRK